MDGCECQSRWIRIIIGPNYQPGRCFLYLEELLFYIFESLFEDLQVWLEALCLHGPPLLQRLASLRHELQTLGRFLWAFLHTEKSRIFIWDRVWLSLPRTRPSTGGTLKSSRLTSLSSLTWASSLSRATHCSLYISAKWWACFNFSCVICWNK